MTRYAAAARASRGSPLAARVAPYLLYAPRRAGADTAVIRELAGHADIRITATYTAVSNARLERAIDERSRQNRGARRAATQR